MTNNSIINQALDALRASLPVGDVVSTTAVKFWNWETDNRTVPAILIYADLMGSGNSRCLEAAQRILRNELKDFE